MTLLGVWGDGWMEKRVQGPYQRWLRESNSERFSRTGKGSPRGVFCEIRLELFSAGVPISVAQDGTRDTLPTTLRVPILPTECIFS